MCRCQLRAVRKIYSGFYIFFVYLLFLKGSVYTVHLAVDFIYILLLEAIVQFMRSTYMITMNIFALKDRTRRAYRIKSILRKLIENLNVHVICCLFFFLLLFARHIRSVGIPIDSVVSNETDLCSFGHWHSHRR